jgi:prolyl-tRNA synthetase
VVTATEKLYADLKGKGFEVLFDDRQESPGVKFNDADLLGIPIRLVVSPRTLKSQSAELKWRDRGESQLLPLDAIAEAIGKNVSELTQPTSRTGPTPESLV